MDTLPKKRPSGPLGKKPNMNAYSDMIKEAKKKYYKKNPEVYARDKQLKEKRAENRAATEKLFKDNAEDIRAVAEWTPPGALIYGIDDVAEDIKKQDWDNMKEDALWSLGIGAAGYFLPKPIKAGAKWGWDKVKGLFKGPLSSPQYNSEGSFTIPSKKMVKQEIKDIVERLFAPLSEKPTQKQREKIEDMLELKLELKKDYPNSDVIFQHSMNPNRNINNFRSRAVDVPNKAAYGQGPGLFAHGLTDAHKFEQFGPHVYAIVHPKNKRVFPGKMDTESNLDEIFVRTPDIEDLVKVNLRGE